MSSKRIIKAGILVKDIRAGIVGSDLMEKHALSRKGLQHLLERLLNARAISRDEYHRIVPERKASEKVEVEVDVTGVKHRQFPRIRTHRGKILISETYASANRGIVLDISEGGVRSVGMIVETGAVNYLEMTFAGFPRSSSISFWAKCRWTAKEQVSGQCMAGFEIATISDDNLALLRQLIQTYFAARRTNRKVKIEDLHWIDGKWTADASTKTDKASWLTTLDK